MTGPFLAKPTLGKILPWGSSRRPLTSCEALDTISSRRDEPQVPHLDDGGEVIGVGIALRSKYENPYKAAGSP